MVVQVFASKHSNSKEFSMGDWTKASPGIRYREHATRKHSGRPDRYWVIYFKRDGQYQQEALGWSSEGMNLGKAQIKLHEFKSNARLGTGPVSSKEQRQIQEEKRKAEEASQEFARLKAEQAQKEEARFCDLIDSYIEWAEKNKKSHRMDVSRCRFHLKPFFGEMKAKEIDAAVLTSFKDELVSKDAAKKKTKLKEKPEQRQKPESESFEEPPKTPKKLSEATIKHCFVLIRQIFNYSLEMGIFIGKNPIARGSISKASRANLVPNKLDNQRLRFLTPDETKALLANLKERSQQTHDIALFSLRTGARFEEIISLEWQHVDFFNARIQIKGKNGQTRFVFMTPDLKAVLIARSPGRPDELVFKAHNRRKQLEKADPETQAEGQAEIQQVPKNDRITQISWAFWRAIKELKLNDGITDPKQKVVFHTLRHTFASWLAQQGTSIFIIKELMGHEKIEMTMRYAKLMPDNKKDAVMKIFNESSSGNVTRMADHR